jgi:hypothetical protein
MFATLTQPTQCPTCAQHLPPLALLAPAPRAAALTAEEPAWSRAARTAHQLAQEAHGRKSASLRQCRTLCQLLTSTTVTDRERRRAVGMLAAGATKEQAARALEYLLPAVQLRRARRSTAFLAPLAAAA